MNIWKEFIEYVNKRPIGTIIYRKDLLSYIGEYTSIDRYRKILCKSGYLNGVWGEYEIIKHVEPENTYEELYNLVYKDSEFVKNNIRYKKLKELLK
jgi:hypothetical protein